VTPQNAPSQNAGAATGVPSRLKDKIKDGFLALSLANLCYIKVSFDLLSDADRFFDQQQVTTTMLFAFVANVFALALVIWLALQALRRFPGRLLHLVAHLFFFCLLLFPIDFIRIKFFQFTDYQIYKFLTQPVVVCCAFVLMAFFVWKHRALTAIAAVLVEILSPLAFFTLGKIALISVGLLTLKRCDDDPAPLPLKPVVSGRPRVLWIIFDETDYRLTFEQRPQNVLLPDFDRLRSESFCANNAYEPADATLISMPSLVLGRRISSVDPKDTCDLSITFGDTKKTTQWHDLPSVFSKAQAMDFNTAVVGWYIPYARELKGSLNFCKWYPYPPYEPSRADTFAANVSQQILSLGETFWLRRLFIDIHQDSLKTSLNIVTNSAYGLTLLHLPAPHRPGVYLPDKDKYTIYGMAKTTGYFNNLILADRELGQIRRAMEGVSQWDKTWVILSADHSWRESKLYDGQRDLRIPFLVKPPGSHQAQNYSPQFNTVITSDLILAILHGDVTDQESVASWLTAHGKAFPIEHVGESNN